MEGWCIGDGQAVAAEAGTGGERIPRRERENAISWLQAVAGLVDISARNSPKRVKTLLSLRAASTSKQSARMGCRSAQLWKEIGASGLPRLKASKATNRRNWCCSASNRSNGSRPRRCFGPSSATTPEFSLSKTASTTKTSSGGSSAQIMPWEGSLTYFPISSLPGVIATTSLDVSFSAKWTDGLRIAQSPSQTLADAIARGRRHAAHSQGSLGEVRHPGRARRNNIGHALAREIHPGGARDVPPLGASSRGVACIGGCRRRPGLDADMMDKCVSFLRSLAPTNIRHSTRTSYREGISSSKRCTAMPSVLANG